MLICPAPSGSVQVHATGFVDIYKDKDVFDDLEQQIMMLTMHGGEEGICTGGEDQVGQYYMGEAIVEEYMEDDIVFEDLDEPVNHFCVNFIEDMPQSGTIEAWNLSQETSMNNTGTEETVAEEERISSKGAMGELKSDDTKPTEQKVSGGHLMTEADSLRTNADSEATITTGYENTEGSPICKVNIIRQADQNSEPLCSDKPVQETGAKDLAGGNPECKKDTEMESGDANKKKQVWELTWLENISGKVKKDATEDWNKSSDTEEVDSGNQTVTLGNQALGEENVKQMGKLPQEDPRKETTEYSRSTRHLMESETQMEKINTLYGRANAKEQRNAPYTESKEYYMFSRETARDDVERELYIRMIGSAIKITKILPSIKGMEDAGNATERCKLTHVGTSIDDKEHGPHA